MWGGTSLTSGADCSGFVQSVYRHFGVSIPRTSAEQASFGREIAYEEMEPGDLKKEYLLPIFIDGLLQSGRAQVKVLETQENWFGVTYQEDKEAVVRAFQRLIAEGVYSRNLYE